MIDAAPTTPKTIPIMAPEEIPSIKNSFFFKKK